MLDVLIIAIGKIKENFYREAIHEYLKRLTPYAKIKLIELKAEPFKNHQDKLKSKKIESERILQTLNNYLNDKIFILDERGRQLTSIQFAQEIKKLQSQKIVLVIGGALGWSEAILNNQKFDFLSLSLMTLPHELARVILVEQLYRSVCLITNKDYHY